VRDGDGVTREESQLHQPPCFMLFKIYVIQNGRLSALQFRKVFDS